MSKTQVPIWFDEWLKSPSEIEHGGIDDKLLSIQIILTGELLIDRKSIILSRHKQLQYIDAIINGYDVKSEN